MSNKEKQIIIENNLHSFWVKNIENLCKSNNFLNSNPGFRLFLNNFKLLEDDLEMYFGNKKYIKNKKYLIVFIKIDKSLMLFLTLKILIPFIMKYEDNKEQSVTKLFKKIGQTLHRESLQSFSNGSYEDQLKENIDFKKFNEESTLNEEDYINIGSNVITFLDMKSNLFDLYEKYDVKTKKTHREIIPNKYLNNYIKYLGYFETNELPIIVKPVPWILNNKHGYKQYGGYINNNIKTFNDLIRIKSYTESNIKFNDKMTINIVNYISSIEFCINNKILDFILKLPLNDDLIIRSLHKDSEIIKKYYKENQKNIVYNIRSHNSKCLYNNSILTIAKLYRNVDKFYFPLFLDWRGRIYCQGGSLNYQGGELARSLLLFKNGSVLNEKGVNSLKVYGANAFGLDKKSITKRLEWVDEHLSEILDINSGLWRKADEPLVFLAFCFELQGYIKDPSNFISRIPIYLDATCNGVQHLAAIISDFDLASKVNLVESNIQDDPSDLYSLMLDPINKEIKKIESDIEYARLCNLLLNRKIVKRSLMTISYGVKVLGIYRQLINEHFIFYKKMDNKNYYKLKDDKKCTLLTSKELMILSKIIHKSLFIVHPNLNELSNYFNNIVKLLVYLNLPVVWLTPSGLIISQKYVKITSVTLTTKVLGKTKKVNIKIPVKSEMDKIKQVNSFIPNLVHSMDGSHIALLINDILLTNKDINILTVHDCFATNANDGYILQNMVKMSFIRIYGNDEFINKFHEFILNYIKENYYVNNDNSIVINDLNKAYKIPIKPEFKKTLDLTTQLIKSTYFIN